MDLFTRFFFLDLERNIYAKRGSYFGSSTLLVKHRENHTPDHFSNQLWAIIDQAKCRLSRKR
ncbi:MAG: hypothetical protein AAF399_27705, partial [Bacteroidota bacterium]